MYCNNGNARGFSGGMFQDYQTFWIIVVIAVVVIWTHYAAMNNGCGCGCNVCGDNCGCGCVNNCCC